MPLERPRLILASGSVTRRRLMAAAGLVFDVVVPGVEEGVIKTAMRAEGESAAAVALALADAKAAWVDGGDAVVVGADQILVCEGEWFDKPADRAEARSHLMRLRGRSHTLATAVTCWREGRRVWHHVAHPTLQIRAFTDEFLETYLTVEGEALLGSVGAYRAEGLGIQLFDAVEGEFSAVLGFPLLPLLRFLRECGVVAL